MKFNLFLESKMKDIHAAIEEFLKKNPRPKDEEIHALAEKMGIDKHKFEEHVYMMLADLVKEGGEVSDEDGFDVNIEKKAIENENYREVLYTTSDLQLVIMSLKPGEEIGTETHEEGSQFIRVESGTGKAVIGEKEVPLKDGSSILIPNGVEHNVINTGSDDLKLYALYSPPEHDVDVTQKTKKESEKDE